MKKLILPMLALVCAASCDVHVCPDRYDPQYYLLTVRNTTDKDASLFVPEHGDVDCKDVTGDLPEVLTPYLAGTFIEVNAHSAVDIFVSPKNPKTPLEAYHPEDKVTFYFFDRQVLKDSSWSTVREKELWLMKLSLTPEDVIDAHKEIVLR